MAKIIPAANTRRYRKKVFMEYRAQERPAIKFDFFIPQGFKNFNIYYLEGKNLYDENYRFGPRSTIFGETKKGISREAEERDEKYAILRVLRKATKSEKQQGDVLVNIIPTYTRFLIDTVQETNDEKMQVLETFGDFKAFFFGKRPQIFNFSGQLLNFKNQDWLNDFIYNYENYIRGTRCVENNARVYITYNDTLVEGFMFRSSNAINALSPNTAQFNFSILVTDRVILNEDVLNKYKSIKYLNKVYLDETQLKDLKASINDTAMNIVTEFLTNNTAAGEAS